MLLRNSVWHHTTNGNLGLVIAPSYHWFYPADIWAKEGEEGRIREILSRGKWMFLKLRYLVLHSVRAFMYKLHLCPNHFIQEETRNPGGVVWRSDSLVGLSSPHPDVNICTDFHTSDSLLCSDWDLQQTFVLEFHPLYSALKTPALFQMKGRWRREVRGGGGAGGAIVCCTVRRNWDSTPVSPVSVPVCLLCKIRHTHKKMSYSSMKLRRC